MTTDTSIGTDDPDDSQQSGIDDEQRERRERRNVDGGGVEGGTGDDLTSEDIERGNDRNTSADGLSRAGTTNKLDDDGIELGR